MYQKNTSGDTKVVHFMPIPERKHNKIITKIISVQSIVPIHPASAEVSSQNISENTE